MEYAIVVLVLVVGFLSFWVRNLIISQKKAAEVVIELQDVLIAYDKESLAKISSGTNMWMHDPAFKYLRDDTEFVLTYIAEFRRRFFDAIEVKYESNNDKN